PSKAHSLCNRPQTNLSSSEGSVGKSKGEAGKGCGLSTAIRCGRHVHAWRVRASPYRVSGQARHISRGRDRRRCCCFSPLLMLPLQAGSWSQERKVGTTKGCTRLGTLQFASVSAACCAWARSPRCSSA